MQKSKRRKRPSAGIVTCKKNKQIKQIKNSMNRKARRVFNRNFDIDKNIAYNKIRDVLYILS